MRDHVGGRPERSGSEEAHRPAAKPTTLLVDIARLAAGRRVRLQVAGLAALALISFLAFVVLPSRSVRIAVDGDVTTVSSRAASDVAVVEDAGIELQPGDRVETTGDDALAVRRATEATLEVDGRTFALRTQAQTIEELLTEAQVPLSDQDSILQNRVFVSPDAPLEPASPLATRSPAGGSSTAEPGSEPVALEVRRAVPFTVVEDGHEIQLHSSRETVATALRDVGVRLGPGDRVEPALHRELTAGLEVHVQHAIPVTVSLPSGRATLYSLASTVAEALAEGDVELPSQYRVQPPAETPLQAGLVINIVGISEEQELEEERIESETVYQPDPSLPWGEERVVPGHDGVRYRQYSVVYEDGQLISRELVAEWYDPEPVDTVVYYSTAEAPPPTPTAPPAPAPAPAPSGVPDGLNVLDVLNVYATWYNPASAGKPPSDPGYGITATGVPVDYGVVAVDPSVIPLGTQMYIPGYGYGVAADTGGAISGYMIDLGYPDGVVPDWVTGWVDIYILGP